MQHSLKLSGWWTAWVCSGLLLWSAATPSNASEPMGGSDVVFQPGSPMSNISLYENTSRIIQLKNRIQWVDEGDKGIVTVAPINGVANQIRVQALSPGLTTIILTDVNNAMFKVEVSVMGDVRALESLIRQHFPESSIRAAKIKESVLLTGWVNRPEDVNPIIEIAEQYHSKVLNNIKVIGVQQIALKAKVMEVQRGKIRQMGFNFFALGEQGYLISTPGALTPLKSLAVPFGGPVAAEQVASALTGSTLSFGLATDDFVFQGFLEALKTENLLKVLAEPQLVTVNGRQADFLSGGEFPILVPQSLGTVSVQYKQYGVQLKFVPYILGAGRLRLDIEPEVSDKDTTNSVTLNGNTVPALKTRRVQTQVEMNFGQTLAIAGLINNQASNQRFSIPYLGDMPWIGAAFRRVSVAEAESELLILVTPDLVAPMDSNQVPADGPGMLTTSPTDKELYWKGFLEVPKTGDDCYGGNCNHPGIPGVDADFTPMSPTPAYQGMGIPPQPAPPADGALPAPQDSGRKAPTPTTGKSPEGLSPDEPVKAPESAARRPAGRIRQTSYNSEIWQPESSRSSRSSTSVRRQTLPGLIGPEEGTEESSSKSGSSTKVRK
ncbi:MAG: pilus assembly protein N-terminal domain-containing protein [Planctomycetales bacterium]